MGGYWVQWCWQNVMPPSFWTLLAVGLHHVASKNRAVRNHASAHAQAERHHAERIEQAERHHAEMKSHIEALAVPQKLIDDIKAASRKPGERM